MLSQAAYQPARFLFPGMFLSTPCSSGEYYFRGLLASRKDCHPANLYSTQLLAGAGSRSPFTVPMPPRGEAGVAACALIPSKGGSSGDYGSPRSTRQSPPFPPHSVGRGLGQVLLASWGPRSGPGFSQAWCGLVVRRRRCYDASEGGLACVQASGCHGWLQQHCCQAPLGCGASAPTGSSGAQPHVVATRVWVIWLSPGWGWFAPSFLHPVPVILGQGWLFCQCCAASQAASSPYTWSKVAEQRGVCRSGTHGAFILMTHCALQSCSIRGLGQQKHPCQQAQGQQQLVRDTTRSFPMPVGISGAVGSRSHRVCVAPAAAALGWEQQTGTRTMWHLLQEGHADDLQQQLEG
jgi:hypothetical protein